MRDHPRIKKAGQKGRLKQANCLQGEEDPDGMGHYHNKTAALTVTTIITSVINKTGLLRKSSTKIEINFFWAQSRFHSDMQ